MAQRFSRVVRGQRGAAAKTRYLNYLEGLDIEPDIGSRGSNPDSIALYVFPFTVNLGSKLVLETSAFLPSYNALKDGLGAARCLDTVPATRLALKIRAISAARVSATAGLANSGTVRTSKLTGLQYADYGGTSYSCPFGRSKTSEKEAEAFAEIKTNLGARFQRIYLIEERS